jgi:hypothetical protein
MSTFHASRAAMPARCLTAIVGGYLLASLATVCLSYALPLPDPEAVLAASLCSFALYTAIIIWVFAVPDLGRLWRHMAVAGAALAALALLAHALEPSL